MNTWLVRVGNDLLLFFVFLLVHAIVRYLDVPNQSTFKDGEDDEEHPQPMPKVREEKFT